MDPYIDLFMASYMCMGAYSDLFMASYMLLGCKIYNHLMEDILTT